jgi:hypothetical protein
VNANKVWVGGFAHCANIFIPSSNSSRENAMKNLYAQDNETISIYENHVINLLKSINLLTEKDFLEPIPRLRNYMLVRQAANSVFVALGRLTFSEIEESMPELINSANLDEKMSKYEEHILNLRKAIGWESSKTMSQSSAV